MIVHDDDIAPGMLATIRRERTYMWDYDPSPATVLEVHRDNAGKVRRIIVRDEDTGNPLAFWCLPRGRVFRDTHEKRGPAARMAQRLILGEHPPIRDNRRDYPF